MHTKNTSTIQSKTDFEQYTKKTTLSTTTTNWSIDCKIETFLFKTTKLQKRHISQQNIHKNITTDNKLYIFTQIEKEIVSHTHK